MPEENQNIQVSPTTSPSVLDKPVPNPLAKNPNVHTHKVFATVGLVLIGVIVFLSGLAFIYRDQVANLFEQKSESDNTVNTPKVSTSSAKKATDSAKKDETEDWKTYKSTVLGMEFKFPKEWSVSSENLKTEVKDVQFTSDKKYDGFNNSLNLVITTDPTLTTKLRYEEVKKLNVGESKTITPTIDTPSTTKQTRIKDITLDKIVAVRQESVSTPETNSGVPAEENLVVYFAYKDYYGSFNLTVRENKTLFKLSEDQLETVLSTFKFL